jgi:membrane protein implicated in regulation of membrane protease activity
MASFIEHPWAIWLSIAIVAGIAEMTIPSFTCIFAMFAAIVAAIVSLRMGWPIQFFSFALVLVSTVFFLRPYLLSRFPPKSQMPSRSEALVGLKGRVITPINPASGEGRVLVDGGDWAARSDHPIALDTSIVVIGHDGIVLKVKET